VLERQLENQSIADLSRVILERRRRRRPAAARRSVSRKPSPR
jgi:hypothetical protein